MCKKRGGTNVKALRVEHGRERENGVGKRGGCGGGYAAPEGSICDGPSRYCGVVWMARRSIIMSASGDVL